MAAVDHSVTEAQDKLLKSAPYFGTVLRKSSKSFLACNVAGTTMVVAVGKDGEMLEQMLVSGDIFEYDDIEIHHPPTEQQPTSEPEPISTPSPQASEGVEKPVVLIPRYHVPGSQVWAGSGGKAEGNVHLHVLHDVTLGRRVRKSGQCLCSKKKGSYERAPEPTETKMCAECVKVADANGISWSLT